MRYYNITLRDPETNEIYRPPSLAAANLPATWTSYKTGQPGGTPLPSAMNVQFDLPVVDFSQPAGQWYVRVWGISLPEIKSAPQLIYKNITLSAGFGGGLPLEKPAQAGVLAQGTIYQAFGNWQDTDMTLDMFFTPAFGTVNQPHNLFLIWPAGQTLQQALINSLGVAYPKFALDIKLDSRLVQGVPEHHFAASFDDLAWWVRQRSIDIIRDKNYTGVGMAVRGTTIVARDVTPSPAGQQPSKQILFTDLIGQPTWLSPVLISFKTAMRADINVLDYVLMPPLLATITPGSGVQSLVNPANASIFSAPTAVQIIMERHMGDFRGPQADDWVTVFNAVIPIPD